MKYDYKAVEAKWQKVWEDEKTFHVEIDHKKPKFYALVEFPYPSGAGLHVGHPRSYTALDVVSRKRRQNGFIIASASSYVCASFSRSSVSVIYSDCGENVALNFRAKLRRAICLLNSSYSSLLLNRGRGSYLPASFTRSGTV